MTAPFRSNRIARKLITVLILFSSVLTVGTTGVQLWAEYHRDINSIKSFFSQIERSYVEAVTVNVWIADEQRLQLQMNGIVEFPDFSYAAVRDNLDEVMAKAGEDGDEGMMRRSWKLNYDFRGETMAIGHLTVAASLDAVYDRVISRIGLILGINAVKTFLVAVFLFALVYGLLTRHLDVMARYATDLDPEHDRGDLSLDRGRFCMGRDELDDLALALNAMKGRLFEALSDARQLSEELEIRVRGRVRALTQEIKERKKVADQLAEREARLRDIAETASDWFWEMGPDLTFTYISDGALHNVDMAMEDMIGKPRTALNDEPQEKAKWDRHLADLAAHRPFRDFTYRARMPSGDVVHLRVSGKPLFGKDGEFLGYRGTSTNITAQMKAEARAAQAQDQLRVLSSAMEQSPSAVFITGVSGIIEYVNTRFTELTGYEYHEAVGETPRILKSPDTPREVHADLWRTISQGREWRGEIKDNSKDGSEFWAYATIAPVKDASGAITHFVAIHEDITERKENEERLRDATRRAEVANKAKSELLANMSHELRTPLNAIIGFSDMMVNTVFGPLGHGHYAEYSRDINESGRHLLSLINDILDVSAIEAGKLELRPEPLALDAVARQSMKLVEPRAEKGGVRLFGDMAPDLPTFFGDERRIKQILLNLLSNAVKFTPEDGSVTLALTRAPDGGVVMAVTDTGIGMDEDGVAQALTQFGQVDSKLARKYEGTGLGLPLTKSLVELHGGVLEIRSALGRGTTVTVRFPADRSLA
ncbi:MAG: PAS domain S-box protein [Alphaproteobacteria bacterium]|nr:PAS domain S-box protein [Alphaproteobacteria bacterium]